jgi:8-oxo-dGTP pyrophosphatase MutT (NUDIX family)
MCAERDPGDLPAWLVPLVRAVRGTSAEDFVRWSQPPPVPGGRASAVLILLGDGSHGPELLLIERAERLRSHAGQPAFPGGAVDPGDRGPADTALREAAEEVGLDRSGVRVVALLPELYLPPSGFLVTPVLAWWQRPTPVGVMDTAEVARVERVPVAELVDPANRCRVRHPSGYTGAAFMVRGMTVWGFTAGLLDRVLALGGWDRPWNRDDVRDLPRRALELAARGVPADFRVPAAEHDGPAADDVVPRSDQGRPGRPGTVER